MGLARKYQVDLEVTRYYHCVARCVRRAFLCGDDLYSGRSFDHRRGWVVERIKLLAGVFAIDVCAYAVMSNHLHLVLRVAPERMTAWGDDEVMRRVGRVFPSVFGSFGGMDTKTQRRLLATWRERLTSLSWFMRCLNEWLARRANREDDCKGHFWEGRFKSQALLDDGAILACMSYVDLNPIRAGMAQNLKGSDFASIQQRLRAVVVAKRANRSQPITPAGLAPLSGERKRTSAQERLPTSLDDYIELLDWTRQAKHHGKHEKTGPPPRLLKQSGLNPKSWLEGVWHLGGGTWDVVGSKPNIENAALVRRQRWCKGIQWASSMYRAA